MKKIRPICPDCNKKMTKYDMEKVTDLGGGYTATETFVVWMCGCNNRAKSTTKLKSVSDYFIKHGNIKKD